MKEFQNKLDSSVSTVSDLEENVQLIKRRSRAKDYREETRKVNQIAREYNSSFQHLLAQGESDIAKFMLYDSEGNVNDLRDTLKDVKNLTSSHRKICCIDLALMSISRDESNVLFNDFFFPSQKKWWISVYSRSVYYRLRRQAVSSFLKVFDIWEDGKAPA